MLNIIQTNVSPLRNRRTIRHPNRHILQILVRVGQLGEHQWLVLLSFGRIREADGGHFFAVDVEADDGDGPALGDALRGAGVGGETEPETCQVEGLHAGPADELGVGVQCELAELEEVDGAGRAGLLLGRMREDVGRAGDGLLWMDG